MSKIKQKIHKKFNKLKQFIVQNNVEILFVLGLFFICMATFLINMIAGFYVLGVILVVISIILLKPPKKVR